MATTSGHAGAVDGLTASTDELRRAPLAPRRTTGYDVVRWVLASGCGLLAVVAVVFGSLPADFSDAEAAVASGRVTTVRVATAADDDGSLLEQQRVTWRVGLLQRRVDLSVVPPTANVDWVPPPPPTVERDAGEELQALAPDVRVERVEDSFDGSASSWGRLVPFPTVVTAALLLGWACWLGQLLHGPAPWRATRWAWFWLSWVPGGVLAQLLLAGPTPLVPQPRRPRARLGPWEAFFLWLLLGPLVAGLLTQL